MSLYLSAFAAIVLRYKFGTKISIFNFFFHSVLTRFDPTCKSIEVLMGVR